MESLENALRLLLDHAASAADTEELSLADAAGRVCAQDILSPIAVPPFDRSPLDGYAVHSEDLKGASKETPVFLKVIGEADAGCETVFHPARGEALRIMTGAPVPAECDCVIRQELTDEGMDMAAFYAEEKHDANICRKGEDVPEGQVMIRKGERLTPAHLGVIASMGIASVTVFRRPRVALVCTGDELLQPGEAWRFGKIFDSSRTFLSLRLKELGAQVIAADSVPDDPALAAEMLLKTAGQVDLIVTTGGVSVGKKDIMHQVLPLMGAKRLFWKLAMKPGSPTLAAVICGKLMICLSGNPFSASACFETLTAPVLEKLSGAADYDLDRSFTAPLANGFGKKSPNRRLIRARFNGVNISVPENQSNGALASLIGCNCLVDIPAGSGALSGGDPVRVLPMAGKL